MDELLTAEQLAKALQVPITTLYQWRYKREGPPAMRVGRHLRYRMTEVERWLSEREKAS